MLNFELNFKISNVICLQYLHVTFKIKSLFTIHYTFFHLNFLKMSFLKCFTKRHFFPFYFKNNFIFLHFKNDNLKNDIFGQTDP